ncbi:MAG: hypothetical protein M1837_001178 [Sclerophora amabilis]|nr:MAG: hypothetical protein M1837_001178 [Sclerophora amabilis]
MAASIEGPKQHSQPSRKNKRAWRKNVDISEVQEGLENVREEVLQGGIIAEKPSTELFTFDSTGNKGIQRANHKAHKPLKADEILGQRSAVPAIDTHKRSSKTTDGVLEPSAKRQRRGKISYKELERLRNIAHGSATVSKDVAKQSGNADYDPWDQGALEETTAKDPMFSFLEPPEPIKEPMTLKRAPISLAASGKQVPAVKAPLAEVSYNPDSAAYFAAFTREGDKEVEAEGKRLRQAEQDREKQEKIAAAMMDDSDQGSNVDDNAEEDDESAWEGVQSDTEDNDWRNSRRPERKTQAQRNKIKRRKETESKVLWEKQMRKRMQQADQATNIAKAIDARNSTVSSRPADTSEIQDGDDMLLRRRRLGRY